MDKEYIDINFEKIKELFYSELWPKAVSDEMIFNENLEEEVVENAEAIWDLADTNLNDKKVLIVENKSNKKIKDIALNRGALSVDNFNLESTSIVSFTKELKRVTDIGSFDCILAYDVFDKFFYSDIQFLINALYKMCNMGGLFFIRFHPWSSRHGMNLHRIINKAFLGLIFTNEELKSLGLGDVKFRKYLYDPVSFYASCFFKLDIKTYKPDITKDNVEDFFWKQDVRKRIECVLKESNETLLSSILSLSFVDYRVVK